MNLDITDRLQSSGGRRELYDPVRMSIKDMAHKSFSQGNTKMPLAIREAESSQRPEL